MSCPACGSALQPRLVRIIKTCAVVSVVTRVMLFGIKLSRIQVLSDLFVVNPSNAHDNPDVTKPYNESVSFIRLVQERLV